MNTRHAPIADRIKWLPRVIPKRRFPRFEIEGDFVIDDVTGNSTANLLDVSVGGFRSSSRVAISPGTVRNFRFPLGSTDAATLSARVVHCYPASTGSGGFTVGWTWANAPVNVEGLPIDALAILDYLGSDSSPVKVRKMPMDDLGDELRGQP